MPLRGSHKCWTHAQIGLFLGSTSIYLKLTILPAPPPRSLHFWRDKPRKRQFKPLGCRVDLNTISKRGLSVSLLLVIPELMIYNFDKLLQMQQLNLWKTPTSSQLALHVHVMFYKQHLIEVSVNHQWFPMHTKYRARLENCGQGQKGNQSLFSISNEVLTSFQRFRGFFL